MKTKIFYRFICVFLFCGLSPIYAVDTDSNHIDHPLGFVELTARERAWLTHHPKIRLATATSYPPFVIQNKDGTLSGLLVDYVELINQKLGSNIGISTEDSWESAQNKAKNKTLDGLAIGAKAPERERHFTATDTIFPTYFYVYARTNEEFKLRRLEDLNGLRVGFRASSKGVKSIIKQYPGIISVSYDDNLSMSKALLANEVDVLIAWLSFERWMRGSLQGTIQNVLLIDEHPVKMVSHIRKDWPELVSILNKTLFSLRQDGIPQLLDKWFIQQPKSPGQQNLDLTSDEKAWLKQHPVIRYGFDPLWAPIEYADDNGEHKGMSAAYMKIIGDLLGVDIKPVASSSWKGAISMLNDRKLDVLPAAVATPERSRTMVFTETYLSIPISIFSSTNMSYLDDIGELYGKKVAVVKNYAITELLKRDHPNLELLLVENIEEGLNLVNRGEALAFIGNLIATSYYIGKDALHDIRIVGDTVYKNNLSVAIRNDWPEFVGIVQKAINVIPENEKNKIYHDWISIRYERGFDYAIVWKILVVVGIIFLMITYWHFTLKREIERRKQAEIDSSIAKEKAEKANNAKSTFLASMAHELRTPMNAILGFSQLIKMDSRDDSTTDSVNEIIGAGKHLLELINQLLDLSKIESGTAKLSISAHSLNRLVGECLSTIGPIADSNSISIMNHIDASSEIYIAVDKTRFRQVVLNLLSNAIKYNCEAGSVTIEVDIRDENFVSLSVTDTGKGLTDKQKKHLFNAYDRVGAEKSDIEGTGLGLVISKDLVELMDGEIGVESELGKGTTFWITMPIAEYVSDDHSLVS